MGGQLSLPMDYQRTNGHEKKVRKWRQERKEGREANKERVPLQFASLSRTNGSAHGSCWTAWANLSDCRLCWRWWRLDEGRQPAHQCWTWALTRNELLRLGWQPKSDAEEVHTKKKWHLCCCDCLVTLKGQPETGPIHTWPHSHYASTVILAGRLTITCASCSFSGFSVARLACLSSISSICFQRTPSIRPFGSVPVPASQSYVMSHEGGALPIFSLFEQSGQRLFRHHATTAAQERTTVCWGPHCPNSCYYWPAGETACSFHRTFFFSMVSFFPVWPFFFLASFYPARLLLNLCSSFHLALAYFTRCSPKQQLCEVCSFFLCRPYSFFLYIRHTIGYKVTVALEKIGSSLALMPADTSTYWFVVWIIEQYS